MTQLRPSVLKDGWAGPRCAAWEAECGRCAAPRASVALLERMEAAIDWASVQDAWASERSAPSWDPARAAAGRGGWVHAWPPRRAELPGRERPVTVSLRLAVPAELAPPPPAAGSAAEAAAVAGAGRHSLASVRGGGAAARDGRDAMEDGESAEEDWGEEEGGEEEEGEEDGAGEEEEGAGEDEDGGEEAGAGGADAEDWEGEGEEAAGGEEEADGGDGAAVPEPEFLVFGDAAAAFPDAAAGSPLQACRPCRPTPPLPPFDPCRHHPSGPPPVAAAAAAGDCPDSLCSDLWRRAADDFNLLCSGPSHFPEPSY
jgi:hypothetical protein